jgi:hypothetical protein
MAGVRVEGPQAVHRHAALDPSVQGRALVVREVVVRPLSQERENTLARARGTVVRPAGGKQALGQGLRLGDDVDDLRHHRARRHRIELRRHRVLRQGEPPGVADGPQTLGPVRGHAREDDPDGALPEVERERREEGVDGQGRARGTSLRGQAQDALVQAHEGVGGDEIHGVVSGAITVGDHRDGQGARALQKRRQAAVPVRCLMLDHHVGQAGPEGHVAQEPLQGVEAARGRPEADDADGRACFAGGC